MSRVQLALNVNDIDEAVTFYSNLFGAEPAKRRAGYANFAISEPPLKLVLLENPGQGGSLNHLGVEVTDTATVDAEQARLAAAAWPPSMSTAPPAATPSRTSSGSRTPPTANPGRSTPSWKTARPSTASKTAPPAAAGPRKPSDTAGARPAPAAEVRSASLTAAGSGSASCPGPAARGELPAIVARPGTCTVRLASLPVMNAAPTDRPVTARS